MNTDSGLWPGKRFGHLEVTNPGAWLVRSNGRRRAAVCRCDCGNDKLVSWNHLTSGRVTSCGCLARNVARVHVEPGHRSGTFTVVGDARDGRDRRVLVRCDCGTETTRSLYTVAAGVSVHCGSPVHRRPEKPPKPPAPSRKYKLVVEPGDRYGTRTVTETGLRNERHQRAARTVCDCGKVQMVALLALVRSESCGHQRPGNRSHGMSGHPLFEVHKSMMARCYREGSKDFRNYGARGIRVHEPWHDIRQFVAGIEAEIGPRPDGRHPSGWSRYTLDRIDNDRDYEPGNVRWATRLQQRHNQRPAAAPAGDRPGFTGS